MEIVYMSDEKMNSERRGMLTGGLITLGVGVVFLLNSLGILRGMGQMWPLFPIVVGIALIIGSFFKGKKSDDYGPPPN